LIAGINDRIVKTSEQSVRLNRELADSELQLLEGVGHMSHHARPDLVIAAVNGLSNRVEGDQIRAEQSSFVGQDA